MPYLIASLLLLGIPGRAAVAQVTPEYWALVPDIRIGSVDAPNYSLTAVRSLEVAPDGSMYVAQPQNGLIRVFDRDGRFLRDIGRGGAGPGEFRDIGSLGWRGDTLWVADFQQSRITLFSRTGSLLDVVTIQGPMLPDVSTRPTPPSAILWDGTLLGLPLTSGTVVAGGIPLLRMSRAGALIETFGALIQDQPRTVAREVGGMPIRQHSMPPIPQSSLFAILPAERAVVLVHRPLPESAARPTFHVEVLRSAADTVLSRRYGYDPVAISRATADSIIEGRAEAIRANPPSFSSGVSVPTAVWEGMMREGTTFPPFQAPITAVVGGRDGTIWLRREDIGVEQVEWIVLDIRGDIIAWFNAPVGLRILRAQRDTVWGTVADELDVPYVVRFNVQARRP